MDIPKHLYDQICRVNPIPCVDLLVTNEIGQVLLLKRKNEPMKNQWWFPGGRVLFNETRQQAVIRKLNEECNLTPLSIDEVGTYDLILEVPASDLPSHAITTLFHVLAGKEGSLVIDEQSSAAKWCFPADWMEQNLHEFVKSHLTYENLED
ncbi:MAG: hypothetical protein C0401_08440 [Anaerolinea sp.]|nr:hypothetical protein [Anaerolinea sp.]